ncbi:MAG: nuclear transport factor 2 family protein [Novosphingobium sp.]
MAASDEIVGLETRFWQSMVEKDVAAAMAMIAEECLVTGPHGAMRIDPDKYGEMTRDGKWSLDRFEFSDVAVVFPTPDVAVIAYKVHQQGSMGDKDMDLHCADASTWVRSDGTWKCSLHTESIIADAPPSS